MKLQKNFAKLIADCWVVGMTAEETSKFLSKDPIVRVKIEKSWYFLDRWYHHSELKIIAGIAQR